MNEPTPPPTTTRPNFFTSDGFTIFFSSESGLWLYGASAINISKHTPRVKITELTPLERVPIGFIKTLLPVDGITGEKGHFSIYVLGLSGSFPLKFASIAMNNPYLKQKIEEHYTYNYPPTTATTP
jgi:hypothetical protein